MFVAPTLAGEMGNHSDNDQHDVSGRDLAIDVLVVVDLLHVPPPPGGCSWTLDRLCLKAREPWTLAMEKPTVVVP